MSAFEKETGASAAFCIYDRDGRIAESVAMTTEENTPFYTYKKACDEVY